MKRKAQQSKPKRNPQGTEGVHHLHAPTIWAAWNEGVKHAIGGRQHGLSLNPYQTPGWRHSWERGYTFTMELANV